VTVTQRTAGLAGVPPPRDPSRAAVLERAGFALIGSERHRTYAVARYRADRLLRIPSVALDSGAILPGRRAVLTYSPASRPHLPRSTG
jgi:hypothetical protein